MRLRPSGNQGPLATQFRGFLRYQSEEAETWERMALTRARVVAGDAALGQRIAAIIRDAAAAADDLPRSAARSWRCGRS